ncbi:hypothetical protein N9341_00985 [Candidatus Pelagibacter sp.]|nr:hypothetical protein [Candidatus Pelagibacter sp.]
MDKILYVLKKNYKIYFSLLLIIITTISVYRAFDQAQLISFDFHFSPTKLVSEGINHYQYILDGKHDDSPNDRIMYDQNGNYAQGLFVMLIPFTLMDWDEAKLLWSIINILIAIFICIILCNKFNLSRFNTFLVCSIFLSSTIFRIHIAYGQQTLLMFIFLILPFLQFNKLSIIFSGIAFFKYNIGYGLFIYFLSLKKITNIFLSLIPLIIGWILYCFITNTNLLENLLEPLKVILYWNSFNNHFPVTIFSFLEVFNVNSIIVLILPLIISFIIINKIKHEQDNLKKLSILCLSILAFAPHQLHDYVILLPLLIFSIKNFNSVISKINLVIIFYFFYGLRIFSFFYNTQPWEFPYGYFGYLNNFIVISLLLSNLYFPRKN